MQYDFDYIQENFKRGYRAEGGILPKQPQCNIGKLLPQSVDDESAYNHELYEATNKVLERMEYILRRYFVIMATGNKARGDSVFDLIARDLRNMQLSYNAAEIKRQINNGGDKKIRVDLENGCRYV